jgi:hypothetical protein
MPSSSQPTMESPFVSLVPPAAPAAEPSQLPLTTDPGSAAVPVAGDLVGNLAGMKVHLRLTGDMTIRHEAHTQPSSFRLHELEAPDVMPPPAEFSPGEAEMQAEGFLDTVRDMVLNPVGTSVDIVSGQRTAREEERHKAAVTALIRAIPDDPDWAKHVPLEYRLDAKEIVDFLLEDLHQAKARVGDDLERLHTGVEFADWGIALAEMFEVAGAAMLFGPVLATAGLFLSLGAGYAAANEAIAIEQARVGFSLGVVTSSQGMSAARIKEHWGDSWSRYGAGAADNANAVSKTYRLGGLGAGFLQGRRLSANQRTVFWKDLQRRLTTTKPDWVAWAGVFLNAHVQTD